MLASVTHDLKTPINGMIAQIDSMDEEPQSNYDIEKIRKVLNIVKINIKMLLFLVYDI